MKNVYTLLSAQNQTAAGRKTLTSISKLILALIILVGMPGVGWGQIAQFNFPATNSLVVSVKDNNVAVSNFALSTGTIETNITTGSYFPNEPYIEETGGWTSSTQAGAKNFYFTITANTGYQFSITNISFRAYATSAGPSAFGFAIGSSDIYSVNAPDASIVAVSQTITGQSDLTTATIKIQGWLNGSRTSAGSGAFRLDDVIITGTVTSVGTPSITLSDNGTQITASDVNQATTAHILHKSALAVTTANATLTGMTCTTAGTYVAADITNLKVRYSTDNTLDAGDATLSTYTNPGAAGAKTFPSFTPQSISSGSTGYIFITADVAAGATHNNTISVDALATSNFTFSSGNKSGSTTAGGVQTFKDVTGPSVSTYNPADNATGIVTTSNLVLTFNENIQKGTGSITIKKIADDATVQTIDVTSSSVTISGSTLTIDPSDLAYGTRYYVNLTSGAIQDLAGNNFAGITNNSTWNFTTVAPSVTNVTSTNPDGTYKVGDLLTITVAFNDIVVVTGSPYLLLNMVGTDRQAAYSGGSGTNTLSFSHTIVPTDGATDLDYVGTSSLYTNGGSINSQDAVAATRTLATPGTSGSLGYNKNIVVDGVAPTVNTYNPSDGNISVAIDQNLILTFNENVKLGTSGNIVIYNAGGTVFETIPYNDGRITFSTNTVTINPTSLFSYSSDYYIQTTGSPITDMYDNVYAGINNATTWNFSTVCGNVSVPYSQGFNSSTIPSCWTTQTVVGSSAIQYVASSTSPTTLPQEGTYYVYWNSFNYSAGTERRLISPGIVTTGIPSIDVSFYWMNENSASYNSGIYLNEGVLVQYSTDGTNWDAGTFYPRQDASLASGASEWKIKTLTLPIGAGNQAVIYISLKFHSEYGHNCSLDNLVVNASPSCVVPTLVTSSSVTSTTATISWTASVSSPSNGYQYEIRTSGAAGSGATGLAVSGTTSAGDVDAAITGLTDNTTHNVYVRCDCGSGDYSAWTTAYTFTTAGIEAPTANAASSVGSEGFTANWNTIIGAENGYLLDVSTSPTFGTNSPGTLTEGFEAGLSSSGYVSTTLSLSSGGWNFIDGGLRNPDNYAGTYSCQLKATTGTATTPALNNVGTLTFYAKSPSGTTMTIEKLVNNTATVVATRTITSSWAQYNVPINDNSQNLQIILNCGSNYVLIDDVSIGYTNSTPSFISGYAAKSITGQSTAYSDVTGLTPNSTYYYRLRAVGTNSTSTNSNAITVTTALGTKVSTEAGDWNTITWNPAGVPTEDDNVTINHAVTLAGNADCNDLTIGSGSLTLASGASIITRGVVSGDVTVNRDLTGGVWHFISSPVTNATSYVFNGKYLQYFTESDSKYHGIIETNYGLSVSSGYAAWSAGAYNASFTGGSLNTGNYSNIALSKSGDGWNLVGNPYPSALDWSLVTGTNLEGAIYIENGGSWATWNNNVGIPNNDVKYISPCQGFFVQANGAGAVMNITNAMRTHTQNAFYKQSDEKVSDMVRLEVSGNGFQDQAIVRLRSEATAEYDGDWDAYKMFGDVTDYPQIYTLGSAPLAINAFRELAPVQVGVRVGKSGAYTIAATEINNLQNVKLEDTKTGIFTDLTSKSYTFDFTAGENEQRFKLHFTALDVEEKEASKTTIYANQQTVYVIMDENSVGDIYIYNLAGQLLAAKESATGQVTMGLSAAGVYLVKVITPTETLTRKVVIR